MSEAVGLLGGAQHLLHARVARHDILEGERAGAAALEALEFGFERARRQRIAQRDLQPFGADRLDHEVHRARAHRRHHLVDAAMRGLHDHRDADAEVAHAREHAVAVEIGHHQVEHDAVDARVGRGHGRDRRIAAVGDHHLVAEARRHAFEQAALHGIVIDDQDRFGHGVSNGNCADLGRTMAQAT